MHLITLSVVRRLISGVDITPSIIRQEYFFSFHYKPYNLCTSHYNQPFKTIPFSCVYLIIPFHFQIFFFILLHPSIIQRTHVRCAHLTSTCYFVNFRVVVSPIVLQNFHYPDLIKGWLRPPVCLPGCFAGRGRAPGPPAFGPDSANRCPSHTHGPSKLTSSPAH